MTIYSPTTRLLTVLEMLQSRRQMSGSEIARRLEVDLRTVRRYIVMLQDMGIPVETERGPHGGYQIQRGYKLPPLMYTDSEAIALTLGLLAIRAFRLPVDVAAVEGALAKTERVMPEKLLRQARGLQESLRFNVTVAPNTARQWQETMSFSVHAAPPLQNNEWVTVLTSATQEKQRVWLQYEAWNGELSEREFDPYGVVYNEGWWYTSGYCHLRRGLRTFRLDRITALELREATFDPPTDFDTLAHVLSSLASTPGVYQVEVLLKTTMEKAREVIVPPVGYVKETERGIIFHRESTELNWIALMLFQLDFPVTVLQPMQLRDIIRNMARTALEMIDESID
jgi:predicted DNA-binding transcriptional regulator YafY